MNTTNTTAEGVVLTFTSGDGVFIGIQALAVLITLFTMFLLFLFRKQKALKTRSISPYIAIVGIWMLVIRFIFWNISIFRTQNPIGVTHSLSCWFSLISMSPISLVFTVIQTLTIVQYFAQERLNSIKDLTWSLMNDQTFKKKTPNKIEKLQPSNQTMENPKDSEPVREVVENNLEEVVVDLNVEEMKEETSGLDIEKKEISIELEEVETKEEPVQMEETIETEKKEIMKQVPKEEVSGEIPLDNDQSVEKIKKTPTTTDVNSANTHSTELDREDLKELRKLFWKIKITRFFISDFFKICVVISSYVVRYSHHLHSSV
jgi:hypothetical protein